jgi:hypothetical protein
MDDVAIIHHGDLLIHSLVRKLGCSVAFINPVSNNAAALNDA